MMNDQQVQNEIAHAMGPSLDRNLTYVDQVLIADAARAVLNELRSGRSNIPFIQIWPVEDRFQVDMLFADGRNLHARAETPEEALLLVAEHWMADAPKPLETVK